MTDLLVAMVEQDRFDGRTSEVGGPERLTIEALLQTIRRARTGRRGRVVHVPLGAALLPLAVAEAIGLGGLLPVSAGQLSSFRWDGTVDESAAAPIVRSTWRDVSEMLALVRGDLSCQAGKAFWIAGCGDGSPEVP